MGRTFLDLNWASTVINTLLVAFFVLAAGGIFIGVYSARTLGKREKAMAGADTKPVDKKSRKEAKAEKKAAKAAKADEKKPAVNTPGKKIEEKKEDTPPAPPAV